MTTNNKSINDSKSNTNMNLEKIHKIKNLVISGGSIRGFLFVGAIKYLEEIDVIKNITSFTGTSIGGCLALLLSINYSSKELIEIFTTINIDQYEEVTIDNIFNFVDNYGINNGDKLLKILKIMIINKLKKINNDIPINENITFKKLYDINKKKITIIGCCLNDMNTIIYNHEKTPDINIFHALRITFSIPFIFTPVNYENKLYVDGGLLNNYPIELHDKETTLGLISTDINIYNKEITNIENYITSILLIMYYNDLKRKLDNFKENTINLEYNVNSFDFSLDKNKKNKLIEYGYNKIKELLA
jgi:NTE family protein